MEGMKCPIVLQLPHKNGLLNIEVKSLTTSVSRFSMYALEDGKTVRKGIELIFSTLQKQNSPVDSFSSWPALG